MVAGGYFFAKYKFHKLNLERSGSTNNRTIEIYNLKRTGQKVKVTLENSEVNTRTFQQEIINEQSSKVSMLDALYDSNRNYKSEEIKQTYIVYCQQIEGKTYKFISQPTPHEPYIVKSMIVKHRGVDLYIDPKNPGNYCFDLPYL